MTLIRAIIFTILVPGTIAGWIPQQLSRTYPSTVELGAFRFVGVALMIAGFVVYVLCVARFLIEGGGTPAIWFTKPISFLIGEEPRKVVTSGLYRFSRNPMYLGVLTFVLGEAFLFERQILFFYMIALWLFFHCVVVFIEEPHLKKKEGAQYDAYLKSAPRWIKLFPHNTRRR
jgi:protein-S-isoprenylcysteine O-methyltransferase Ste14